MAVTFESYERRIDQIKPVMGKYGIKDFEDALKICTDKGFNPYEIVKGVQPICFENAAWAYTLGAAIAIKKGCTKAADAAKAIGEGLQAFCIPGSVADDRKVGLGHGNLASMLLSEDTKCFAFLAGHESFAAAEGAIGIAKSANKVRKEPLRVILNGLGKDAAQVISRINGFTYVKTDFDFFTGKVKVVDTRSLSSGISLVMLSAIDLLESGMSVDEVVKQCKQIAKCTQASFTLDSLRMLYKGGRCSGLAFFMGKTLGLKPSLLVKGGKLGVNKKYMLQKYDVIVKRYVLDTLKQFPNIKKNRCFVTHTPTDPEVVQMVKDIASQYFDEVIESEAGATICSHCGKNTIGILYVCEDEVK